MILRVSAVWTFLTVLSAAIAPVTAQAPRDQHEAHRLHEDRFLIVDVWHHVENQPGYLAKMKERLKLVFESAR